MLKMFRKPVFFSLAFLFAFCVSAVAFIWFVLAPDPLDGAEARQAWLPSAATAPAQQDTDDNPVEQPAPVQTDSAPPGKQYFQTTSDPIWNIDGDESLNTGVSWPDIPITGSERHGPTSMPANVPLSQRLSGEANPEPATLILMASGASAIVCAALRRRKRAAGQETR
jgi:hypothetical protein